MTALADGAKWIWNEIEKNLPGATGVPDIYHAGEHLHDPAVALHGAGPAAEAWYQRRRRTLLESGSSGLLEGLMAEPGDASELVGYLGPHAGHTPDRERLAEVVRSAARWSRGRARRPSAFG